jgi:beta-glucanase (GH16 family)
LPVQEYSDGVRYVGPSQNGDWLAFDVNIPVAGRYKTEIHACTKSGETANCWVEDYYDNKDGRTYNITSAMSVPKFGKFATVYKDGSPLNAGQHKIKLHLDGPHISIEWIKFTLIKKHQVTPKTLIQPMDGENWNLVWSDEFEEKGLPDSSKWTFDIGNWGWGNNEPQYYTEFRTENARQENGNLVIEARKNDNGHEWTSCRLTTRGKVSFLYGKIEFRAKAPTGDGTWAAGWLLGDAYRDEISWPYCGEIDVLECVGREIDDETGDGINHASCHTRAYYFKQGNHISNTIKMKNMNNEFHTYGVIWTPRGIEAYVDGTTYYTYDKLDGELEWPFNNPQNLIINLAMGGGMGGDISPEIESQKLIVDYIRVYELK